MVGRYEIRSETSPSPSVASKNDNDDAGMSRRKNTPRVNSDDPEARNEPRIEPPLAAQCKPKNPKPTQKSQTMGSVTNDRGP